ncbi:rod shape-determining protein MreC [Eisenbergiella porci]|uniref:rod shape-determining protein MreC n=1 Tax=Eisenbergiella porci TaxID=2652274 RepID=UPI002A813AA6|nr:rod shape-determining protein MreC [Eisenbergiella porci]
MSPVIKKKRNKFTLPGKYLLMILSAVCVILMIVTFRTDLFEGPLRAAAGYVVVPFQKGIASVGGYMYDRAEEMGQLKAVLEENQKLKEQVDELTMENAQLQQDKYELASLRELYDIDKATSDYEKTGARVIASDSSNWFYSFTIDKGSDDGIQVDMNVLAGSGLAGRVVSVGPNYARVLSIIADNSNIYGTVLSTSANLMVSGNLQSVMSDGVIRFDQLSDKEDKVSEGDKVVTSNISSKYLSGIPIGFISSINTAPNNMTKWGYITPAVDFQHIQEVLVIMELKQPVPDKE